MRILFFGTYDERTHPRVRVLREGLQELGFDVEVCNRPIALSTAERVRIAQRPWLAPVLVVKVLAAWTALWRGSRARRPDVVVVGYLGQLDVHLARWRFRRSVLVLDQMVGLGDTVRDRDVGHGWLGRMLDRIDRAATGRADVVLVDTTEQGRLVQRPRTLVVPVGAPREWFEARRPRSAHTPLRVVFFGLYTPLQGTLVIADALRSHPDVPLECTMVGTGQDRGAAQGRLGDDPRVRWLDWVDADELPALVASHDVCLGIFGTGDKARRVVPNKVYQGAAAGCAIVTSDTPPQARALEGAAVLVPPGDPVTLGAALADLAGSPTRTSALRTAAATLADRSFTPAAVAADLAGRLERTA